MLALSLNQSVEIVSLCNNEAYPRVFNETGLSQMLSARTSKYVQTCVARHKPLHHASTVPRCVVSAFLLEEFCLTHISARAVPERKHKPGGVGRTLQSTSGDVQVACLERLNML